jgi:hypothetical protein
MKLLRTLLGAIALSFIAGSAAAVPLITVEPGDSPFGYIPLNVFGTTPFAIGDEDIVNFNVPNFLYAGQNWNRIGVVSNGYAIVGGGDSGDVQPANNALPDPLAPTNMLAPFWTDLDPESGGELRITTLTDGTSDWLVIDWFEVVNFADLEANSFEIWIGLNGVEDITFTYGAVSDGDLGFLTVGANDITGLVGATSYFDGVGTLPVQGTELRVTTSGVPEPATIGMLGIGLLVMAGLRRRRQAA